MTDANEKRTMKEVDHTHPYDDRSAGALFARGPVVVTDGGERERSERESRREAERTDGGERNAGSRSPSESRSDGGRDPTRAGTASGEDRESEPTGETMKDVDHTPPNGEEGANRVFERGEEFDEEGAVVEE